MAAGRLVGQRLIMVECTSNRIAVFDCMQPAAVGLRSGVSQYVEQFRIEVAAVLRLPEVGELVPSTPPSSGVSIQHTPTRFAPLTDSARSSAYFR